MNVEMNKAIAALIENIKNDYYLSTSRNNTKELNEVNISMINDFNEGLGCEVGRKYAKITSRGSVWGFVVLGDDAKFKVGDILKAASWTSPTRNKARGNVMGGNYKIQWTGPNYL